jgi:hypothetical protein
MSYHAVGGMLSNLERALRASGVSKSRPAPSLTAVASGSAYLTVGDYGKPVNDWRVFLGLPSAADPARASFDKEIEAATAQFQSHMKLDNTGFVDSWTYHHTLAGNLKPGDKNETVRALNRLLGLGSSASTWSSATTKALEQFQEANLLPRTGALDTVTRAALLAQGMSDAMSMREQAASASAAAAAAAAAHARPAKTQASDPAPAGGGTAEKPAGGMGSMGGLIMLGLAGVAAYLVWASPRVKRPAAR